MAALASAEDHGWLPWLKSIPTSYTPENEPLQEHAAKVAAKMEVLAVMGVMGRLERAGRKSGVLSVSCKVFHILDVERSIC